MKPIVHLKDVPENVIWLDARFRIGKPSEARESFYSAHIPKAQYLDLETDLSGAKNEYNGRHPLPRREDLINLFSRLGIDSESHVIIYDDLDHAGAARAWAMLRWMGHNKVQVLNGGLAEWKKFEKPLESGNGTKQQSRSFIERPSLISLVAKQDLSGQELVDARAPERYRGEVEPLDKKAGHIPGAKNLFYKTLLTQDGKFFPDNELKQILSAYVRPTFYCGSGVTGAVLLLAAEQVGLQSSLYPGSWSEWSQDPNAPVEKS